MEQGLKLRGGGETLIESTSPGKRVSEGKAATVKEKYVITTNSGDKYYVQIMSDGTKTYLDKNNKPIDEKEFTRQTGLSGDAAYNKARQKLSEIAKLGPDGKAVYEWNKSHPQNKVTFNNGKYSTTVKVISTHSGSLTREVSANSFAQLKAEVQKAVQELKNNAKRIDNSVSSNGTGSYASIGRAMQH